jgi:hypothetical protein
MSTVATTTMESRIKKFLKEKELDEDLCEDFVNLTKDLFGDLFKHLVGEKIPSVSKKSSEKKAKLEIDDLVEGIELSDLKGTSCTSAVLDDYIKKNGLRASGTKTEKAERVYRHISEEPLPDDLSPKNKPKEPKAKKVYHDCCGRTSKGTACATAATEEYQGHWFCWRHIDTKDEFIDALSTKSPKTKKKVAKKVVEESEEEEE